MFDITSIPSLVQALDLLRQGGPIVLALVLLSVAALAVTLIKATQFATFGVGREHRALNAAITLWRRGNTGEALERIAGVRNPRAGLVRIAMQASADPRPIALIREEIEADALAHLAVLRANLRVLEASAALAPLIGLFGTVIGMMSAFQALQSAGAEADPTALAGGIWTALITTAVGLAVAIPASLALYWFEGRLAREQTLIETAVTRILTAPAPPASATPPNLEILNAAE